MNRTTHNEKLKDVVARMKAELAYTASQVETGQTDAGETPQGSAPPPTNPPEEGTQ